MGSDQTLPALPTVGQEKARESESRWQGPKRAQETTTMRGEGGDDRSSGLSASHLTPQDPGLCTVGTSPPPLHRNTVLHAHLHHARSTFAHIHKHCLTKVTRHKSHKETMAGLVIPSSLLFPLHGNPKQVTASVRSCYFCYSTDSIIQWANF